MTLAKTTFQCSVCGGDFPRFLSRNRGSGIYCSHQCFGLAHSGQNGTRYGLGRGFGYFVSEETKRKIGIANKGKLRTEETKRKMSLAKIGKKLSLSTKAKMSATQKIVQNKVELKEHRSNRQRGSRHWNWKGGISSENHLVRCSYKFRDWRELVFQRDDYTCQNCGLRGVFLHPHHILAFAEFPKLRFDVNNGRTLCIDCHKDLHFGGVLRA